MSITASGIIYDSFTSHFVHPQDVRNKTCKRLLVATGGLSDVQFDQVDERERKTMFRPETLAVKVGRIMRWMYRNHAGDLIDAVIGLLIYNSQPLASSSQGKSHAHNSAWTCCKIIL
jgi:hypothetical protein